MILIMLPSAWPQQSPPLKSHQTASWLFPWHAVINIFSLILFALGYLPVLKTDCSSWHESASNSLLLVSVAVKRLWKRASVLRGSWTNRSRHLLCTTGNQHGSTSSSAGLCSHSSWSQISPKFWSVSLTVCTSKEPTETFICGEMCFECCYPLLCNNVFHLLVFLIPWFDILVVQDLLCYRRGRWGVFFVSRHFHFYSLIFYSFLYAVFPSDCVCFKNFHDKNWLDPRWKGKILIGSQVTLYCIIWGMLLYLS